MKLRFTFRSDKYDLPSALELFEFTRAVYQEFSSSPAITFKALEKNIVVMGQLQNGLFFSFTDNPKELFMKYENRKKAEELKLEMSWPIPNMIRIEITNIRNMLPFRVDSSLAIEKWKSF